MSTMVQVSQVGRGGRGSAGRVNPLRTRSGGRSPAGVLTNAGSRSPGGSFSGSSYGGGADYGGGPVAFGSTGDPGIDMLNFSMPAGTEFGNVNQGDGNYMPIGRGGQTYTGGGGGGGGYDVSEDDGNYTQPQSNALRRRFANPEDVTATTPVNPMESHAYDRASDYERGLADDTNEEVVRELGRARDDISVGMQREGEAALGRGADASLFRSRALESGKRDLGNLQARLADVSLGRREGAVRTLTGAAGQAAEGQRSQHFQSIASRLAEQRYQLDASESQSRMREAPYDRLLKMLETYGRYPGVEGGGMTGGAGTSGRRGKVGFGNYDGNRSGYSRVGG